MNTRGYEKVEGLHYDAANIASPVTNYMRIRIVMVLTMVVGWIAKILDMGGFFFMVNLKRGESVLPASALGI